MKKIIKYILFLIILITTYNIGFSNGIGNQSLNYGTSGFPKNCRALISENIGNYKNGNYTPVEALGSIDRNCGANGYIWNER